MLLNIMPAIATAPYSANRIWNGLILYPCLFVGALFISFLFADATAKCVPAWYGLRGR